MTDGSARVFGIDLGTTYSAIAYLDETGRPTVCRNEASEETTPSVVHFETPTNVVVGQVAKEAAAGDPDNVVSRIKRSMGSDLQLEFHGEPHTPEAISACILRRLAADAAAHTDGPVEQVVITVPAYFGGREKKATENAGIIAGLDVVGIVPEPVAAAVHYDLTSGGIDKTVLVYDLGGGTFDTTVIRVDAEEVAVVCTDGHTNLGGADWDDRLRDHVIARFVAEAAPPEPPEDDPEFLQDVQLKVEQVKKQLSQQESRPVPLRFMGKTAKIEVSRAEFETMTADLLDSTIEIVKRTLATFEQLRPGGKIDEVLLVGGSTKMPMVAARLAQEFGWEAKLHDPDLAVAKGAAIWGLSRVVYRMVEEAGEDGAASKEIVKAASDKYGIAEHTLAELTKKKHRSVLPKAFGIKLQDSANPGRDFIKHLAFANDPLPTGERNYSPVTAADNQTGVRIEIWEQAGTVLGEELSQNTPLNNGSGVIDGLPPQPRGAPIDIVLSIDEDGLLQLGATERTSGKQLKIDVTVGLTGEEIAEATQSAAKMSITG